MEWLAWLVMPTLVFGAIEVESPPAPEIDLNLIIDDEFYAVGAVVFDALQIQNALFFSEPIPVPLLSGDQSCVQLNHGAKE